MSQQQTIDQFVEVASMLADTARSVVRPWFRRGVDVDSKKDASPVTVADRTAERVMRAILAERLPDHGVFGEEFGQNNAGADYQWLLDPVDGTRAFVTGRPLFGTLIALFYKGEPILGILDQPVLAERWVGVKGRKTVFASTLGGRPAPGRAWRWRVRKCPAHRPRCSSWPRMITGSCSSSRPAA